jgi:hypothetical protein
MIKVLFALVYVSAAGDAYTLDTGLTLSDCLQAHHALAASVNHDERLQCEEVK